VCEGITQIAEHDPSAFFASDVLVSAPEEWVSPNSLRKHTSEKSKPFLLEMRVTSVKAIDGRNRKKVTVERFLSIEY